MKIFQPFVWLYRKLHRKSTAQKPLDVWPNEKLVGDICEFMHGDRPVTIPPRGVPAYPTLLREELDRRAALPVFEIPATDDDMKMLVEVEASNDKFDYDHKDMIPAGEYRT